VTAIKDFKPDVVFFAGQVSSQGATMAKNLKEQGLTVPVFGGDGFYSQKDYIDNAGGRYRWLVCLGVLPGCARKRRRRGRG